MPVAVNPIRNDAEERNVSILGAALGLAKDIYRVKMDDKQLAKAQELAQVKQQEALSADDKKLAWQSQENEKDRMSKAEIERERIAANKDLKAKELALKLPASAGGALKMPGEKTGKESKITGTVAENIGSLSTVGESIKALEQDYNALASGVGSSLLQFGQGTNADQYNQKARVAVQNIGYALEGGKMTDSDREFYKQMTPQPEDSNARAAAKILALKQYAQRKFKGVVDGLKQSGFDISQIREPDFGLNPEPEKKLDVVKLRDGTVIEKTPDAQAAARKVLESRGLGTASK